MCSFTLLSKIFYMQVNGLNSFIWNAEVEYIFSHFP